MNESGAPTRFGGILDRCGRPAVGRAHGDGWGLVCEGCWHEVADPRFRREPFGPLENQSSLYVACECVCGHVAAAPLERMDRSGKHLRCPDCAAAGHLSAERSAESFASDPRVPRRGPA